MICDLFGMIFMFIFPFIQVILEVLNAKINTLNKNCTIISNELNSIDAY
jgi:hypothetical protein